MLMGLGDPILAGDESWGMDMDAEIAAITDDVSPGTPSVSATKHIKLVRIAYDISFRNLVPEKLRKGLGF